MLSDILEGLTFDDYAAISPRRFKKNWCCFESDCLYFVGNASQEIRSRYVSTFLCSFVRRVYRDRTAMRYLFCVCRLRVESHGNFIKLNLYRGKLSGSFIVFCPVTTRVDTCVRFCLAIEELLLGVAVNNYEKLWSAYSSSFESLGLSLPLNFCSRCETFSDHADVYRESSNCMSMLVESQQLFGSFVSMSRTAFCDFDEKIQSRFAFPLYGWCLHGYEADYTVWSAFYLVGALCVFVGYKDGVVCDNVVELTYHDNVESVSVQSGQSVFLFSFGSIRLGDVFRIKCRSEVCEYCSTRESGLREYVCPDVLGRFARLLHDVLEHYAH